jgi:undecaprenyl-diphosphatase
LPLSYLDAVLIGILQGLAEWLPISSKSFGMLYLVGLKGGDPELAYSMAIWLHVGSFPASIVVFRHRVIEAIRSIRRPNREGRNILRFLALGTIASGIVGVPLYYLAKGTLAVVGGRLFMILLGILLVVTGIVDLFTRFKGYRHVESVATKDSLTIGGLQGLAAIPGISRSGITILAASARGFDGEACTSLSFMLSILAIPAIAAFDLMSGASQSGISALESVGAEGLLIAGVSSFLTSILLIKSLLALARRVRMGYFVMFVGVLALILNCIA